MNLTVLQKEMLYTWTNLIVAKRKEGFIRQQQEKQFGVSGLAEGLALFLEYVALTYHNVTIFQILIAR